MVKKWFSGILAGLLVLSMCGFTFSNGDGSSGSKGFSDKQQTQSESKSKGVPTYEGTVYNGKNNRYSIKVPAAIGSVTKSTSSDSTSDTMVLTGGLDGIIVMRMDRELVTELGFTTKEFVDWANDIFLKELGIKVNSKDVVKIDHPNANAAYRMSFSDKSTGSTIYNTVTYIATDNNMYIVVTLALGSSNRDVMSQVPLTLVEN